MPGRVRDVATALMTMMSDSSIVIIIIISSVMGDQTVSISIVVASMHRRMLVVVVSGAVSTRLTAAVVPVVGHISAANATLHSIGTMPDIVLLIVISAATGQLSLAIPV